MLGFKAGIKLANVTPQIVLALMVAERVYETIGGTDLIITSVNDGEHKVGSLHGKGQAVDLRTQNIPDPKKRNEVYKFLRSALTPDYDVLWEFQGKDNEHIHIEWDPK